MVKVDHKMCYGWMGLVVGDLLTGNARLVFSAPFDALYKIFFLPRLSSFIFVLLISVKD